MKEQLISFETAKLAHSKGCYEFSAPIPSLIFEEKYRPTQSLLQKWLREIHNVDVSPHIIRLDDEINSFVYYPTILTPNKGMSWESIWEGSYEEALEKGLQEALKLI